MATIARVLQNCIVDIAKWTPFKELAIVFESSRRAVRLVESGLSGVRP